MPAPPARSSISGTPTNAVANTGFGALWDFVTGLLGLTGNAADARTALEAAKSGAVTGSGLTMATARLLGRLTAGSGAPEELTGAQAQGALPVNQPRVDVASSGTVNLTTGAANTDHVNITGTTTITGFTVAAGRLVFVRFAAALTLTNNGNIVTQSGANISVQAGDTCMLRATAANVVEVLCFASTSKISQGVVVASTSGAAIDFTGIPSWAKRINVMFEGVSTSGTASVLVQLGDSGGIENTGYAGSVIDDSTASAFSVGFSDNTGSAAISRNGLYQLCLMDASTNTWACMYNLGFTASGGRSGAGVKSLSASLDRVRVTTGNGTDTFDAGKINISWE